MNNPFAWETQSVKTTVTEIGYVDFSLIPKISLGWKHVKFEWLGFHYSYKITEDYTK